MILTMHHATVSPCVRALTSLTDILHKADGHAASRKVDPAVLLGTRLFPDMLPLSMQIVIAGDTARGGAARLAGAEVPVFESGKTTFAELIDGVQRSIGYLRSLQAARFILPRTVIRLAENGSTTQASPLARHPQARLLESVAAHMGARPSAM